MPTTYTHYKFGREVIDALPELLRKTVESGRELFDIGLHGPDILFYYHAPFKNRISGIGYQMHDRSADEFFERAAAWIRGTGGKGEAAAYIYGFICHFALDSECHGYIEKMIHASGISHSEIEMELDRLLLTEDSIDPVPYLGTNHIHPTQENAKVIAPFFEGVTAQEVKKALSSMITCHKLLLAPNPVKRKLLFGGMKLVGQYKSLHGMVMSETPNPLCRDYCLLLKKRFAEAAPLAAELITAFQKFLDSGGELPERFHRTFGAGDNWEGLQL